MEQVLEAVRSLGARMERLETAVAALVQQNRSRSAEKRKAKAVRQARYRKKQADEGKTALLKLPTRHVLRCRDPRVHKVHGPALRLAFERFAALDKPFEFARYIAWYWNSKVYKKRPVAFSAGYFQVWLGTVRNQYGAFDLMGYNRKQVRRLRNEAELSDFRERPWWDWCYHVLMPLLRAHDSSDAPKLPEHFDRCVRLVLGDLGEYEVYTDMHWGQSEDLGSINKMLKRVSSDLWTMWAHFLQGLRSMQPVPLPKGPLPKGPAPE